MLLINALLAAYEMALASISRTKISVLFQENQAGAQAALFMKDHLEGSLAVGQNVPSGDAVACGHLPTHNLGQKGGNKEPLRLITELQWFTFFYLPSGRDYFFLRLP